MPNWDIFSSSCGLYDLFVWIRIYYSNAGLLDGHHVVWNVCGFRRPYHILSFYYETRRRLGIQIKTC